MDLVRERYPRAVYIQHIENKPAFIVVHVNGDGEVTSEIISYRTVAGWDK